MNPTPTDCHQLLTAVKQRVREAQYRALQQVNQQQMQLYWDLGQLIAERQQEYGGGKGVVETLACDLQTELAGMSGFSVQNLWYMRQFYFEYSTSEILQPLVGEISWAKHLLIMGKCKDPQERLFYTLQTHKNNWTKAVLAQQLKARAYESTVLAQHNLPDTLPAAQLPAATLALKDEYTFGFLGLTPEHSECELEQALRGNVRRFLMEMGGDFAFIGTQYRLELEGQECFIDLLLFHRELQCLVAVALKITEFQPGYAGKMDFYLSLLNERVKKPHEQPSIGIIIICQSKQRTVVEFALHDVNKPIGVATYPLTDTLPAELRPFFPSNEELVRRLDAVAAALQGPASSATR